MPLTHLDADHRPAMVDVSEKHLTYRTAKASAVVVLPEAVRALVVGDEIHSAKGPVFQAAILAGTMAVKRTSDLIPLCHPLPVEQCKIDIHVSPSGDAVIICCSVGVHHKTGVEMEALTGASLAALTVYDMLKAVSHDIIIERIELLEKTGGKRDFVRGTTTEPAT